MKIKMVILVLLLSLLIPFSIVILTDTSYRLFFPYLTAFVISAPENPSQNFTVVIKAKAFETFKEYDWKPLVPQEFFGTSKKLSWLVADSGEGVKIESNGNITIHNSMINTTKDFFPLGSCGNCNLLVKHLNQNYYISSISASVSGSATLTLYVGKEAKYKTEERINKTAISARLNKTEIKNLGKIENFNLDLGAGKSGKLNTIIYYAESDNPFIKVYFSDTRNTTTQNKEAEIIAEFSEI